MWSLSTLLSSLAIMLAVAYTTLLDRKCLGLTSGRLGVNKVSFTGLLQPLLDALKLLSKEQIYPAKSLKTILVGSPLLLFVLSLLLWNSLDFYEDLEIQLTVLYVPLLLSISVLLLFLIGLSGSSKYSFLGALRSCILSISFEVGLALILFGCASPASGMSLTLNQSNLFPFWAWAVVVLCEVARSPIDLGEAESELVSGSNLDHSSLSFVLFFLSEYTSLLFMSYITSVLFFGGSFALLVLVVFLGLRAVVPRIKVDSLMSLVWLDLLPLSLLYLFLWTYSSSLKTTYNSLEWGPHLSNIQLTSSLLEIKGSSS